RGSLASCSSRLEEVLQPVVAHARPSIIQDAVEFRKQCCRTPGPICLQLAHVQIRLPESPWPLATEEELRGPSVVVLEVAGPEVGRRCIDIRAEVDGRMPAEVVVGL